MTCSHNRCSTSSRRWQDGSATMRAMSERPQTLGEEIANSVSHGVALVASIVGAPVLIGAARDFGAANVVGASVFAATMILLYLSSTLYHAIRPGRLKRVFHKLDHSAIYFFIAGSYTPFALGALGGPRGWTLFGTGCHFFAVLNYAA